DVAHHPQSHTLLIEFVHFSFEGLHKQAHEQGNLFLGTSPVLGTEGKQGAVAHPSPPTGLDHATHRLYPTHMSRGTRQETLSRPTTVAVHDDGQVARHFRMFGNGKGGALVHRAGQGHDGQTVMIS